MTDGEYKALADSVFRRLEAALDSVDAGLDYDLAAGGVLEIEFDDGSMIVVNRQAPLHEIWVAARGGGFHYRWDGASWRDTRSGEELFAALSRLGSEQARTSIVLV
jgi:CyaY protein